MRDVLRFGLEELDDVLVLCQLHVDYLVFYFFYEGLLVLLQVYLLNGNYLACEWRVQGLVETQKNFPKSALTQL